MRQGPVVALAGGIGAARFLDGLTRVLKPERVSLSSGTRAMTPRYTGSTYRPDLDTVTYTLAGLADRQRGWGIRGDTFSCLEALGKLGSGTWFQLGDRDLATHLYRTERLQQGANLADVTSEIAAAFKVRSTIVPMSEDRVRTRICTPSGELEFRELFRATARARTRWSVSASRALRMRRRPRA